MRRPSLLAAALALAATGSAALAVAGCAGSGTVDSRQVDTKLVAYLHQTRPGIAADVSCPSGVRVHDGATFTCSVLLDGDPTTYDVTIDNVAGTSYDIAARPTEPIFDTQQVAAAVRQQEGAGTTVDCGSARFVQVAVHKTFTCQVTVNGVHETLTATVTDAQGGVSFAAGGAGGGGPTTTAPTGITLPGGG